MMKLRIAISTGVLTIVAAMCFLYGALPIRSAEAQTCGGAAYSGASSVTVTAGNAGSVWGSGPFTTDSNLATIALFLGGRSGSEARLSIENAGCESEYSGSTQNGVTTSSYAPSWYGMYVSCISGCDEGFPSEVSYETSYETSYCSGSDYEGASPRTVTSSSFGTVYGSGPFRTDSSLGKIARFLGASGSATLVITNVGCTPNFSSGTNNGVTTSAYNSSYKGMTVSCTSGCGASCSLPWGGTINSGQSTTAYQASSVPYGSTCTSQTRSCSNGTLSGTYQYQSCSVQAGASCTLPWGGTINSGQSTTAYQASSVPYGSSCTSQTRSCTNGTLSGTYQYQSCSVQAGASCSLPWGGTINSGQSVTAYQASSAAPPSSCSSQSRTCTNGTLSGTNQYQTCTVGTPSASANASPGDTVRIYWSATNGWSYSSTYSVNQNDACGNSAGANYTWSPGNTSGGFSDVTIAACQAGRTYTYTYRVTNSAGYQVTSSATITVTAVTSCALSANPTTILRGQNSTLSWTSNNATAGTINPGSMNASPVDAGSMSVAPSNTTTYTGTFTGATTAACTPVTVNVQCAPLYSCSGQQIQYTDAGCTTVNVGPACVSPTQCVPGQSTCSVPPPQFTGGPGTTGHLEANPQLVRKGTTSKLFWNVTNVTSCTVTGNNGDVFSGGCSGGNTCTSGAPGQVTSAINSTVLYTLNCTSVSGATPVSISETVSVLPSPEYSEN